MKKNYTYFNFKDLEGNEFVVKCWTNCYTSLTHNAQCMEHKARVNWGNRPWESFQYKTVLRKIADKIGGDLGEYMKVQIKGIEEHTREEAEKWFNNFKARYDALGETTKKHLANSGVVLESQEQAESVMKVSEAFDVMFKLMGDK